MSNTMFVKINDIEGDATEKSHEKWITVSSISWGIERPTLEEGGSSQQGFGKAVFGVVELESQLGSAAAQLMLSVANGTIRKEIVIHQCRAGDDPKKGLEPYLIWTLKESLIQSYYVYGAEESIPTERWGLMYNGINVEYKATDIKTGKLTKYKEFTWNLASGEMG